MLKIKIEPTGPLLAEVTARLTSKARYHKQWGLDIVKPAQASARSHSKGGGFWGGIAQHVRLDSFDESGATVLCDHFAAAHKEFGGEIRAKNAKALTIPINDLAKGKRVGQMRLDGFDIFRPPGTNVLAYTQPETGQLIPLYALVKSVTHKPEPWWPAPDEVARRGRAIMLKLLTR